MSTEESKQNMTFSEYSSKYQKERKKGGMVTLQIKPSDVSKLKNYYDEYVMTCQQNQYAVVDFHHFVLQFCEIGFFSWRDRNKGK